MPDSKGVILVTGATGQQGGAAMRHLIRGGWGVRALVRNPEGDKSKALKQAGAELVKGDLYDRPSVDAALKGVYGVFSVQNYWLPDVGFDGEVRQGNLLADAAKAAGVKHFVYSSVGAAHRGMGQKHFESKWVIEQHVQTIGLPFTILRPAAFMENFVWQKPAISNGAYSGMGLTPGKSQQTVAVDDIGAFVALAFSNQKDYASKTIELSGDELTEAQTAATLARVIGREVRLTPREGGGPPNEEMKAMREFFNGKAYDADIPALRRLYPGLHTFEGWLRETGWENLPVLPIPAQAGWGRT
jgi:uncharacterized protein YbjT (DUF2867 family)